MSYQNVTKALKDGADPDMLCMTCPWDRFCITPPQMTSAEVDEQMKKATLEDRQRISAGRLTGEDAVPVGMLLTALVVAGKDTQAQVCPVLAMRLRLPEGKRVVDTVKEVMRNSSSVG